MFKFDPNSTEKQGRWRLRSPSEFSRMWTKHDAQAQGISYIVGLLKTTGKFGIQSIRFDRTIWTEKKAANWWKKNKSRFKKYWTEEDWKNKWKEPRKTGRTSAKKIYNPILRRPQNRFLYEHQLEKVIPLFIKIIAKNSRIELSLLLAYLSISFQESRMSGGKEIYSFVIEHCKDCLRHYTECACEGSREIKYDTFGNRMYAPCEECRLNYCLCDYDIKTSEDLIVITSKLAKEVLNPKELNNLKEAVKVISLNADREGSTLASSKYLRFKLFLDLLMR